MKPQLRAAFTNEMTEARTALAQSDLERSFSHLERAHILGQRYFAPHLRTHWWMLRVGQRRSDVNEIRGQIMRMIAVVPGSLFGWVPLGNPGGANISPVKPMPIPADLEPLLAGDSIARDVLIRAVLWVGVAAAVYGSS